MKLYVLGLWEINKTRQMVIGGKGMHLVHYIISKP